MRTDLCLVLDSEALFGAVLRERGMTGLPAQAHRARVRVVTGSLTLIEAYRSSIRGARFRT